MDPLAVAIAHLAVVFLIGPFDADKYARLFSWLVHDWISLSVHGLNCVGSPNFALAESL